MVAGIVVRAKFYSVWKISEACALISGVGIRPSENPLDTVYFDGFENVNVLTLETGENVKGLMGAWNVFTANWLRWTIQTYLDDMCMIE